MLQMIMEMSQRNAGLLAKMVEDVPDERMCQQPPGLPNHAAWQIGHITLARSFVARELGASLQIPETLPPLFGRGSTPTSNRNAYPSKKDLLDRFNIAQAALMENALKVDPARLAGEHGIERLRPVFPTLGHLIVGVALFHDGFHLGQLGNWRRAMGLPSVIG
jgi:hypothetical protein